MAGTPSVTLELPEILIDNPGGQMQGLRAVLQLAAKHGYEYTHTHLVTRLALQLFDELTGIHRLKPQARFYLTCGAILHDIAKGAGESHYKRVLQIVMNAPELPFDLTTRRIIGLVARYHRKASPSTKHSEFALLDAELRQVVTGLAAILRIADGLDCQRVNIVNGLHCVVAETCVRVHCRAAGTIPNETHLLIESKVERKSVLFEQVFNRSLRISWS